MHFTRDPIIETVITPREGCKLVVRSTKNAKQEEYLVDAIEVVSFGHSFFYRSIERPKSFLVPVSDYEVFEAKETKLSLKKASSERSIKISGGKTSEAKEEEPTEKKPKEKRRRSRKSKEKTETKEPSQEKTLTPPPVVGEESAPKEESVDEEKASSFISKLFPPPSTLIKETIGKYKSEEPAPEDLFHLEESETSSEEQDLGKIDETPPEDQQ